MTRIDADPCSKPTFGLTFPHLSTVAEISDAIEKLDVREQIQLLQSLPQHLKVSPDDIAWSQLAETSFAFWDNPDDAIYDQF